MKSIGLISDTHNYIHPRLFSFFEKCDEIWHAGDIGSLETASRIETIKPLIAVHGNIDNYETRIKYPEYQEFECGGIKTLMTHIGGYPKRYNPNAKKKIEEFAPKLFISGHSHILKVMYDKQYDLLHINPGAAGKQGLHRKITFVRFNIDKQEIKDLEIFEADK